MASKLDGQLISEAVDKILAFSQGKEVAGVKGKARGFLETIELQVRKTRRRRHGGGGGGGDCCGSSGGSQRLAANQW